MLYFSWKSSTNHNCFLFLTLVEIFNSIFFISREYHWIFTWNRSTKMGWYFLKMTWLTAKFRLRRSIFSTTVLLRLFMLAHLMALSKNWSRFAIFEKALKTNLMFSFYNNYSGVYIVQFDHFPLFKAFSPFFSCNFPPFFFPFFIFFP